MTNSTQLPVRFNRVNVLSELAGEVGRSNGIHGNLKKPIAEIAR